MARVAVVGTDRVLLVPPDHPIPRDEAWLTQRSFAQEHHTRVTLRRHIPGALAVLAGEVDAATDLKSC